MVHFNGHVIQSYSNVGRGPLRQLHMSSAAYVASPCDEDAVSSITAIGHLLPRFLAIRGRALAILLPRLVLDDSRDPTSAYAGETVRSTLYLHLCRKRWVFSLWALRVERGWADRMTWQQGI